MMEAFPTAHELSESAYAVETRETVDAIVEALDQTEPQDELYVIGLAGPLRGHGPLHLGEPTVTWLADSLRRSPGSRPR